MRNLGDGPVKLLNTKKSLFPVLTKFKRNITSKGRHS